MEGQVNKNHLGNIEIWMEGFSATGQSQTAQFLGGYKVDTFNEAIEVYKAEHPNHGIEKRKKLDGREFFAIWGCELYDNEKDARRYFG